MKKDLFRKLLKKNLINVTIAFVLIVVVVFLSRGIENYMTIIWAGICFIGLAFALSFISYYSIEHVGPKKVHSQLESKPLKGFIEKGFTRYNDKSLSGEINGYQISLYPMYTETIIKKLSINIEVKQDGSISEKLNGWKQKYELLENEDYFEIEILLKNYNENYSTDELYDYLVKLTNQLNEFGVTS